MHATIHTIDDIYGILFRESIENKPASLVLMEILKNDGLSYPFKLGIERMEPYCIMHWKSSMQAIQVITQATSIR
ncbi:MAG: hypothetical protein QMD13_08960 [Candidatus Bathyarchaeia archaeon]|nr:hypothetical protein [Candidatus Bathyarchaeia archaeon]